LIFSILKNRFPFFLLALALFMARPCLASSDKPGEAEYQTGFRLYQMGKYQEALHHFYLAADENLDSWKIYHMIGNCFFILQQRDAAIGAYQESLKIHPDNPGLLNNFRRLQSSSPSLSSGAVQPLEDEEVGYAKQPTVTVSPDLIAEVSGYGMPYVSHRSTGPRFPVWLKLNSSFTFANMQDLESGAQSWNQATGIQSGLASARNTGIELGVESGYNLDEANVISFGLDYLGGEGYQVSVYSSTSDLLQSVSPDTYALGLNYYRNLTGGKSRLYAMGGVGYYFTQVKYYQADPTNPVMGMFTGGTVGCSVGLGNEWFVTREVGVELSGRFRYAKIPQVEGTATNQAAGTTAALAVLRNGTLGVQSSQSLSQGNGDYASIDYTGFDLRLSMDLYLF
jgi:hypothetical protein